MFRLIQRLLGMDTSARHRYPIFTNPRKRWASDGEQMFELAHDYRYRRSLVSFILWALK